MTYFDNATLLFFIIAIGVEIFLVISYFFLPKVKRFIITIILMIISCQLIVLYGSFIEPRQIKVISQNITINENGNNHLKVVVVSDYHLGPYKKDDFVKQSVDIINANNPDIVFLLGDYIYSYQDQADYLWPLKNIETKYGVYAVLGNHDYGISRLNQDDLGAAGSVAKSTYVVEVLESLNIAVLKNDATSIRLPDGEELNIIGLEDIWGNKPDFDLLLNYKDDDNLILLEHNPDIVSQDKLGNVDLVLSGHTHGGQIRLPLFGALPIIPTKLGAKYDYGLFNINNTQLFITKGIGEMGPRARLLCPPEIIVLEIEI